MTPQVFAHDPTNPAVRVITCKREGLGALGSLIGFNKTPLVRTITGLYITYGEREQLASI